MAAAFVIFIIGLLAGVLGLAEMKRAAEQGTGKAVAGILFALSGLALLVIGMVGMLSWE